MPPNTVKVTRPGKWGNPFPLSGFSREEAVSRFRCVAEAAETISPGWHQELAGKNLACWCPIGLPCNADVLMEIANRPTLARSLSEDKAQ
jgi:hypothetical protein